ncbi:MAG: peptide ABC transporter ATP-binding protein [Anaerolineaceae bacterium 4572_32.2]|nr:MAG: peptide ABC transporter ATP-binding protein [Anaerolineaceae bacterium 4572_32.2]
MSDGVLLDIKELKTYFYTFDGIVKAIDGVDLTVYEDDTLGIVGETGCGKSITSLSVLNLVPPPGRIEAGEIRFEGQNLLTKSEKEMRRIRGGRISMIFQNPMSSLNPVFTIGDQIAAVLRVHQNLSKADARRRAVDMFRTVRLPDAEQMPDKYPHELSGGMLQRVMIGMALSCRPRLLIADEPTTALDVTIQAQILRLMRDLKREMQTSIVLITHDLGVVAQVCRRVAVMYAGVIVEGGDLSAVFKSPKHPYTAGLLRTIPRIGHKREWLDTIEGRVPNLIYPPPGCRFHPRCPQATERCRQERPAMIEVGAGHRVACHLYT